MLPLFSFSLPSPQLHHRQDTSRYINAPLSTLNMSSVGSDDSGEFYDYRLQSSCSDHTEPRRASQVVRTEIDSGEYHNDRRYPPDCRDRVGGAGDITIVFKVPATLAPKGTSAEGTQSVGTEKQLQSAQPKWSWVYPKSKNPKSESEIWCGVIRPSGVTSETITLLLTLEEGSDGSRQVSVIPVLPSHLPSRRRTATNTWEDEEVRRQLFNNIGKVMDVIDLSTCLDKRNYTGEDTDEMWTMKAGNLLTEGLAISMAGQNPNRINFRQPAINFRDIQTGMIYSDYRDIMKKPSDNLYQLRATQKKQVLEQLRLRGDGRWWKKVPKDDDTIAS